MIARGLTILISAPVIFACTFFGGIPFFLLVTLLAIISVNEFYNMAEIKGFHPAYIIGNIFTFVFMLFAQLTLKHPDWGPSAAALFPRRSAMLPSRRWTTLRLGTFRAGGGGALRYFRSASSPRSSCWPVAAASRPT